MKKIIILIMLFVSVNLCRAQKVMEYLNRGAVAVSSNGGMFLSWRILGTDNLKAIEFDIYRDNTKLNSKPFTVSNFFDKSGKLSSNYKIKILNNGSVVDSIEKFYTMKNIYKEINLDIPAGGKTPDGVSYTYSPNDCSVGDIDGDGQYEIFLKWDPSNSKDNSQGGYTGDVYIDAYKLDGSRLWRIDLGKNIRAGAHYTQFMVYDFDGNGKAEMICKTAPGTKDGKGNYLSTGPAASDNDSKDYRTSHGYILSGPEYLTVFNGETGAEMATANYSPQRGTVSDWGDNYGNRVDRFLACVAYLDGTHPSAVFQRGYYTRMVLAAWDWDGTTLKKRWVFDSNNNGSGGAYSQGNHNLSVGDVDGDGKDEIIEGACAIDDDGSLLYSTGLGHGDAIHFGDLDPDRDGLEIWDVHEEKNSKYGYELHDAKTGKILWGAFTGTDNGRGLSADIDSTHRGSEMWSFGGDGTYDCKGKLISSSRPSINFRMYWDGDFYDEILDGTKLDKWNGNKTYRLTTFYKLANIASNNSTKQNPCLVADIFGDWREEVIYRSADNNKLVIFTTTTPTNKQMYTLMHDPIYRMGVAWQNTGYNQPPHLGFWLASGNIPTPNITVINHNNNPPTISLISPSNNGSSEVNKKVTFSATATDDHGVSKVIFYATNKSTNSMVSVGEDTSSPYSIDWTPTDASTYYLVAKATDASGLTSNSNIITYKVTAAMPTKTVDRLAENFQRDILKIYPNPATLNSSIKIKYPLNIRNARICIYNNLGELKAEYSPDANTNLIMWKNLGVREAGIYTVILYSGKREISRVNMYLTPNK